MNYITGKKIINFSPDGEAFTSNSEYDIDSIESVTLAEKNRKKEQIIP